MLPTVDAYASLPHYADHLAPIVDELRRRGVPGEFYTARRDQPWGVPRPARWAPAPVLVAGFVDYRAVGERPVVYLEHGAGQTYRGDPAGAAHPSYSDGRLDRVCLFLCPNVSVAARRRAEHPGVEVAMLGDSPKLDAWRTADPTPRPATVAVSFHWDCWLVPETRWAFPHYRSRLRDLVGACRAAGVEIVGHAHPRARAVLAGFWESIDVEYLDRFDDVLARASLLVADNSSALYEVASLDRPVLVLNAPWYRRDVQHGLRFWDRVPGLQVDGPDGLLAGVAEALTDPEPVRAQRRSVVAGVYPRRDGQATCRAVDAILDLLGGDQ